MFELGFRLTPTCDDLLELALTWGNFDRAQISLNGTNASHRKSTQVNFHSRLNGAFKTLNLEMTLNSKAVACQMGQPSGKEGF
jgi:hypothetical protein